MDNTEKYKVLLVGYNGANNTGSEARLLSIIEDLRSLMGSQVEITVPTLNEENLRRYLVEDEYLHVAPVPSIFFFELDRIIKAHDLVLLVEGSCYMDSWTSALLWAFLWATYRANRRRIPCIAYAVDAGDLSRLNTWLVKKVASKTDLIITRTKYAAKRLKNIGVNTIIESTADCAFKFQENPEDHNFFEKFWPESAKNVVGLAVVDFSLWPVTIRPWGHEEDLYQWPYYFSRSIKRNKMRNRLINGWACIADHIIEDHQKNVAIICMEELDQPLAEDIHRKMKNKGKCKIISSGKYNASQMTSMLCELDLLITSRYHSAVLSLRAGIPQIAVGHDPRLKSLYHDLHLYQEYFIHHDTSQIWNDLKTKINLLLANPDWQKDLLKRGLKEQVTLCQKNLILLKELLEHKGIM